MSPRRRLPPGRPKEGDVPLGGTARAREHKISRREFLQASGALVVGLSFAGDGAAQRLPSGDAVLGKTLDPNEVDGFLAIGADGRVTIFCGKVDLGQGLRIAIPRWRRKSSASASSASR